MAIIETKVGPVFQQDGTTTIQRATKTGESGVSDVHGRYQEACYRGQIFSAANQAGAATQAGLSTNSSVFTLFNPVNSGKNLVLLDITLAQTAVLGAAGYVAVWLAGNLITSQTAPATTTAITIRNNLLGSGAASIAAAYSQATLTAAPIVLRQLGQTFFGTAAVTEGGLQLVKDEIAGAIILAPGIYVSVQASAAVTLAVGMTWEEIPV